MARSMRPGREKSAAMSSNVPPTTMPTRRKGRRISHTSGKRKSAASASGQQKKASRQKSRKLSIGSVSPCKDNAEDGVKVPLVDDRGMALSSVDRVVAVDWSGDQGPGQRRKIWAGIWTASTGKVALESGRSRVELVEWLVEMAEETPRMVVGFDFSFSYPAWFLRELGVG